jgi:ribose 5-phosphate isomerase B
MRIALGSDHAGFELKEALKRFLVDEGIEVQDVGTFSPERVDYPEYAEKVGNAVRTGAAERGVLVCGTGIGVCIAANKIHGIRAAAPWSPETARLSREHNDANVLCLSGRCLEASLALELLQIWLQTPFAGGRHQHRVNMITELERHN